jgi:ribosomal protection tetracycline resistance protein
MNIKNIGIYAHVDAGKTTITEQLLHKMGIIEDVGRVDDGTTHTDSLALEKKRGISIQATPVSFYLNNTKINLIDTPGHADFIAEVERSMNVLDGAILVISAREGVQSQTSVIFDSLQKLEIPTVIFVNKIDRIGVEINDVCDNIKSYLSKFSFPIQNVEKNNRNVSQLFECSHEKLLEFLSDLSDAVFESFVEGNLCRDLLVHEFIELTKKAMVYPIIFGSALKGLAIDQLVEAINLFIPDKQQLIDGKVSGSIFKVKRNGQERKTYVRLFGGCLKTRDYLFGERITKIEKLESGKEIQSQDLLANDIGIVYGPNLKVNTSFGDLPRQKVSIILPTIKIEVKPIGETTRYQLLVALDTIADEDPFLEYELSEITHSIFINVFGEIQLEILQSRLNTEFNVFVAFHDAQTILKETPVKSASSQIALYDKNYPFYAEIEIRVEPLSQRQGVEIVSETSTGGLPQTFQNGILDGVNSYINQGLKGWPLTNLKITIANGNYCSVNSTPSDFRNLAPIVFMQALEKADTSLLWPMLKFRLKIPSFALGKTLSDLSQMNAKFNLPEQKSESYLICGIIPAETCQNYELKLKAFTEGKGIFSTQYSHYENAPKDIKSERVKLKVDPLDEVLYLMHKKGVLK